MSTDSHSAMAAELADERRENARLREALQKAETQAKHALSLCRCGHIPTFTCEALGLLVSAALADGDGAGEPEEYGAPNELGRAKAEIDRLGFHAGEERERAETRGAALREVAEIVQGLARYDGISGGSAERLLSVCAAALEETTP